MYITSMSIYSKNRKNISRDIEIKKIYKRKQEVTSFFSIKKGRKFGNLRKFPLHISVLHIFCFDL